MSSRTRFEAIRFGEFPPFEPQTVVFPTNESEGLAEVHLLVGENGTGKTRLLCALASCCGNDAPLASRIGAVDTQRAEAEVGVLVSTLSDNNSNESVVWERPDRWLQGAWDHASFASRAGEGNSERVTNVPADRPNGFFGSRGREKPKDKPRTINAFSYNGAGTIRDAKVLPLATPGVTDKAAKQASDPARLLNFSSQTSISEESSFVLQTIANVKMHSALEALSNGSRFNSLIAERIETVLTDLTGKKFYFELRTVPEFSIRVNWGGVSMTFDQLPDGMRSIIAWLGTTVARLRMIYPEHHDSLSESFILLVDEPETHLHPAWQRKLIPAAQRLFPNAQIFVATHSPFVISSVNHGWIHVFRENAIGHVEIEKARPCSSGDTWIDSVEDVLGIREWYDPETEDMLRRFRETREKVVSKDAPVDELQTIADSITPRSETLRALMGKEMMQARRLVAARGAKG